ncbi:MAG TPA: pitrilysin family protein [Vicinamibacterales bacterium]|nr:pitrilysin family protein [Vicinamibacterales bacterium]
MNTLHRCALFVSVAACLFVGPADPSAQSARPQTQAQAAAGQPTKQGPLVSQILKNGLEIIVLEDHSVPLVTIDVAVRNGSFTEPPELNGLSHLYEHLFFSPNDAPKRPGVDPDEQPPGIVYNGSTREEVVEYYFTTTTPNFEVAARMLADSTRWPSFKEQFLAREREVVIGEMDRRDSNPFSELEKARDDRLFFKYPTRKQPIGTRATVRGATSDMMRLIQNRYYVPNNSAVVIAGDVTPAAAFKTMESLFGDWPRRKVDPFVEFPIVDHPPLPSSSGVILTAEIQPVIIEVGWQGPSVGKDDQATYSADVFSFVLGQPNSKFQRALVDSGLATAVDFNYYTQRNVGPIAALIQTTPDKAKAAVKALWEQISHFADANYFTDEELASSKALLEADDLYSREKPSEYVHNIAFWWSSTGLEYFRGYLGHLKTTTRADIATYLNRYVIGKPHVSVAMMSEGAKRSSGLTVDDLIGAVK